MVLILIVGLKSFNIQIANKWQSSEVPVILFFQMKQEVVWKKHTFTTKLDLVGFFDKKGSKMVCFQV